VTTGGPPTSEHNGWTSEPPSSNGTLESALRQSASRLVVLSYISAVAIPPLGLFLGIIVATRPVKKVSRHAKWIILISIVAGVIWFLIFNSGTLLTSGNDDLTGLT
jgi:hypothetical protein